MGISRRRTAAVGCAFVLVGVAGVGAATAAPRPATPTPPPATPTPAPPAMQRTSASVAAPALAATGTARSQLALSVGRGSTLIVVGVLTRASNGTPLPRRVVDVYVRTADTGTWRLATTVRTSSSGRAVYRLPDAPRLQITLRFAGSSRFTPAASVTIVPDPSATAMQPGLVRALAAAKAAARRAGHSLVVNSGYRNWTTQQRMHAAAVRTYGSARVARRWVLPPQESTHVRGLAADIGTPATAAWLTRHGAAFGLCRAYGDEPWHFEYRPDWIKAFHGRCPAPVPLPGDPDPLSPAPRVAVVF